MTLMLREQSLLARHNHPRSCHVQIDADDLLNAKSWAVRAGAHFAWTMLMEMPSYVFSADTLRAWDQTAVAAAMVPPRPNHAPE